MRLKLRRIFRRFVRQAPYLTYLSFYWIVGIITIWFSQNTTYNFFIRQEMWWGRSLITGRCGKLWRETMWRNTSFCRAALIITRWILSRKIETSLCLPWRSCARSLAVRPMMWSRSNSGCWHLCRWPLFLLSAKKQAHTTRKGSVGLNNNVAQFETHFDSGLFSYYFLQSSTIPPNAFT